MGPLSNVRNHPECRSWHYKKINYKIDIFLYNNLQKVISGTKIGQISWNRVNPPLSVETVWWHHHNNFVCFLKACHPIHYFDRCFQNYITEAIQANWYCRVDAWHLQIQMTYLFHCFFPKVFFFSSFVISKQIN